jgi:hypothetical protein
MSDEQFVMLLEMRKTERTKLITVLCALPDEYMELIGRLLGHIYNADDEENRAYARLARVMELKPDASWSEYNADHEGEPTGVLYPADSIAGSLSDDERNRWLKEMRLLVKNLPDRAMRLANDLLEALQAPRLDRDILRIDPKDVADFQAHLDQIEALESVTPESKKVN